MTIQSELLTARIDVVLVEPWDFVTVNGSGPFTADVLQTDQSSSISPTALLLEVHSPLKYNTEKYRYFIATPRHAGTTFDQLIAGMPVGCNSLASLLKRQKMGMRLT